MPKAPTSSRAKAAKDPKASHLYTDDNPATTIHGTGFKDKAAAERTLDLIKERSLIYQFQTVNTMYHRAKHHPAMKQKTEGSAGTSDMRAAMDIFRKWLDVTYPEARDAQRAGGFKPLLSKACVERYLQQIEGSEHVKEDAKKFAKKYVNLPKGKKLGNVLMNDSKPTEADLERKRYDELDGLISSEKQSAQAWEADELWVDKQHVTAQHLRLIAWAWSPLKEAKLP